MIRSFMLVFSCAAAILAQDPFVPLKLDGASALPTRTSTRMTWVRITNQRLELGGKTLRVALEDEGDTAVVFAKGIEKPRHAKPILTGKGDYALLFKSMVAEGFTRIIVRNPDTGKAWSARLEAGKPFLED